MADEKRLIDADAEIEAIKKYACKDCDSYNGIRCRACWADDLMNWIDDAPKVDAVEVVRGEWIMVIDENDCECIECPLCGEQFYDGDNDTFDKPWNYCPNCGAKMDGDGNA